MAGPLRCRRWRGCSAGVWYGFGLGLFSTPSSSSRALPLRHCARRGGEAVGVDPCGRAFAARGGAAARVRAASGAPALCVSPHTAATLADRRIVTTSNVPAPVPAPAALSHEVPARPAHHREDRRVADAAGGAAEAPHRGGLSLRRDWRPGTRVGRSPTTGTRGARASLRGGRHACTARRGGVEGAPSSGPAAVLAAPLLAAIASLRAQRVCQ